MGFFKAIGDVAKGVFKGVTGIAGALTSPISTGLGIANTILGAQADKRNYQHSRDLLAYQQGMTQETWNREDTAVQRRVADLKAAGLSPVLAAGSAAQASHAPAMHAPERKLQNTALSQQLLKQAADISLTNAERNRIIADTEHKKAQTRMISHDVGIFETLGLPSTARGVYTEAAYAANSLLSISKNEALHGEVVELVKNLTDKFMSYAGAIGKALSPHISVTLPDFVSQGYESVKVKMNELYDKIKDGYNESEIKKAVKKLDDDVNTNIEALRKSGIITPGKSNWRDYKNYD